MPEFDPEEAAKAETVRMTTTSVPSLSDVFRHTDDVSRLLLEYDTKNRMLTSQLDEALSKLSSSQMRAPVDSVPRDLHLGNEETVTVSSGTRNRQVSPIRVRSFEPSPTSSHSGLRSDLQTLIDTNRQVRSLSLTEPHSEKHEELLDLLRKSIDAVSEENSSSASQSGALNRSREQELELELATLKASKRTLAGDFETLRRSFGETSRENQKLRDSIRLHQSSELKTLSTFDTYARKYETLSLSQASLHRQLEGTQAREKRIRQQLAAQKDVFEKKRLRLAEQWEREMTSMRSQFEKKLSDAELENRKAQRSVSLLQNDRDRIQKQLDDARVELQCVERLRAVSSEPPESPAPPEERPVFRRNDLEPANRSLVASLEEKEREIRKLQETLRSVRRSLQEKDDEMFRSSSTIESLRRELEDVNSRSKTHFQRLQEQWMDEKMALESTHDREKRRWASRLREMESDLQTQKRRLRAKDNELLVRSRRRPLEEVSLTAGVGFPRYGRIEEHTV